MDFRLPQSPRHVLPSRDRKRAVTPLPVTCLLLLCSGLQAQTGVLTGTIIDELLDPIAGAKVSLARAGQKAETTADNHGSFRFEKLPAGIYDLEAVMAGFKIRNLKSIEVKEDQTTAIPPMPLFVGSISCSGSGASSIKPLADPQRSIVAGRMVVDRGNRTLPLTNAVITLRAKERTLTAKTDISGHYRIEAPSDTYDVQVGPYPAGRMTFFQGWETEYSDNYVYRDYIAICE